MAIGVILCVNGVISLTVFWIKLFDFCPPLDSDDDVLVLENDTRLVWVWFGLPTKSTWSILALNHRTDVQNCQRFCSWSSVVQRCRRDRRCYRRALSQQHAELTEVHL